MVGIAEKLRLRLAFGDTVDFDPEVLDRVCSRLRGIKGSRLRWNDPKYFLVDSANPSDVSQFFTVGNAMNFRYWSLQNDQLHRCGGRKGGIEARGALYMWRSLLVSLKDNVFPILDAQNLAKVTLDDARRIFRTDEGQDVVPALEERVANLQDLGLKLYEFWGGEFYSLVKETRSSLLHFVHCSRQFRAFDDPICKLTMVNAIMHQGRGLVEFDQSPFPGIDYELIKQVTRVGILMLRSQGLKRKLTRCEMLEPMEARELRNATLYVFLEMMARMSIAGDILDNMWWSNRIACRTDEPVCQMLGRERECVFLDVCAKRIEYKIPLENTRYY